MGVDVLLGQLPSQPSTPVLPSLSPTVPNLSLHASVRFHLTSPEFARNHIAWGDRLQLVARALARRTPRNQRRTTPFLIPSPLHVASLLRESDFSAKEEPSFLVQLGVVGLHHDHTAPPRSDLAIASHAGRIVASGNTIHEAAARLFPRN